MALNKNDTKIEPKLDYGDSDFTEYDLEEDLYNIPRNYITKEKLTIDHVKLIFGDAVDADRKLTELDDLKRDAINFFGDKVKEIITVALMRMNLVTSSGEKVRNLKQIHEHINREENISVSLMQTLFEIFYGIFDKNTGWARCLEEEFMKNKGLRYNRESMTNMQHSGRDKGCFEKLASGEKSDLTRRVMTKCVKNTVFG